MGDAVIVSGLLIDERNYVFRDNELDFIIHYSHLHGRMAFQLLSEYVSNTHNNKDLVGIVVSFLDTKQAYECSCIFEYEKADEQDNVPSLWTGACLDIQQFRLTNTHRVPRKQVAFVYDKKVDVVGPKARNNAACIIPKMFKAIQDKQHLFPEHIRKMFESFPIPKDIVQTYQHPKELFGHTHMNQNVFDYMFEHGAPMVIGAYWHALAQLTLTEPVNTNVNDDAIISMRARVQTTTDVDSDMEYVTANPDMQPSLLRRTLVNSVNTKGLVTDSFMITPPPLTEKEIESFRVSGLGHFVNSDTKGGPRKFVIHPSAMSRPRSQTRSTSTETAGFIVNNPPRQSVRFNPNLSRNTVSIPLTLPKNGKKKEKTVTTELSDDDDKDNNGADDNDDDDKDNIIVTAELDNDNNDDDDNNNDYSKGPVNAELSPPSRATPGMMFLFDKGRLFRLSLHKEGISPAHSGMVYIVRMNNTMKPIGYAHSSRLIKVDTSAGFD